MYGQGAQFCTRQKKISRVVDGGDMVNLILREQSDGLGNTLRSNDSSHKLLESQQLFASPMNAIFSGPHNIYQSLETSDGKEDETI